MTSSGYTSDDRGRINRFAVEPKQAVKTEPVFGFNKNAERYSGRLAMIGFVGILLFELATHLTFVQIVTGV
ncbi:chlorophyll a/b-binding protein [Acaryochloris sp. IP29b_bin.148]|uniref:chlorophyll a/b-binding protein n=1 Tax=Acaryochloris sp. IP29b_bin.148 TaxID=2969218 RepID=UPI0026055E77|nr:chlorophyll a/b-binding protein [Acaryochloris sp. IP29b_bin.148]